MTVKELIEELAELPQNSLVIMSKDAEGNSYSPYYEFWEGSYMAESSYQGEMGISEITDELRAEGFTEEDLNEGVPAVCLCPIN